MSVLTWPAGRAVTQTLSDTNQVIDNLSSKLIALKQSFDSGINVQAVFASARTLEAIEKLGTVEYAISVPIPDAHINSSRK
jgi:hypothetical protein